MKEQAVQKAISDLLKLKKFIVFKHRNVGIFKQKTNSYIPLSYGEKGISDLIACAPWGQFWAIEVKKPGGKPSPEQLDFIARVNTAGGKALLAYSLDEVLVALGEAMARPSIKNQKPSLQNPQPSKLAGAAKS